MRTFANQAERFAYTVSPHEAVQGVQWKQTEGSDDPDVPEIYRAVRQGTGAQCWEKAYTDAAGGDGTSLTSPVANVAIASDVNDWAPSGGALTSNLWRVTPTGAARRITGIDSSYGLNADGTGRVITIANVSTTYPLILAENTGESVAANIFLGIHDVAIAPGDSVMVMRDVASDRWRVVASVWPRYFELTEAATITWDVRRGLTATVTLTADRIIDMVGLESGPLPSSGLHGYLRVIQDGSGSHQFTSFRANGVEGDVHIPGGVVSGLSSLLVAAASKSDLLGWFYDGNKLLVWNEGGTDYFDTYVGV